MKTTRIHSIDLGIEHERKPNQRMPMPCRIVSERPNESISSQPCPDVEVSEHIEIIVVINEVVTSHLPKDHDGYRDQKQADQKRWDLLARGQKPGQSRTLFGNKLGCHNSSIYD